MGPKAPTDEQIRVAPWMRIALGEPGKGVHEQNAAGRFQAHLYSTLAAGNPRGPTLLDWNALDPKLARQTVDALGPNLLTTGNPDIVGYLSTVHTGLDCDRHRSRLHWARFEKRIQSGA
jgi:hypothetical protein